MLCVHTCLLVLKGHEQDGLVATPFYMDNLLANRLLWSKLEFP